MFAGKEKPPLTPPYQGGEEIPPLTKGRLGGVFLQALNSGFISLHSLEQFYGKVITYLVEKNKRVRNLLL
jgi:hypothetical protein